MLEESERVETLSFYLLYSMVICLFCCMFLLFKTVAQSFLLKMSTPFIDYKKRLKEKVKRTLELVGT